MNKFQKVKAQFPSVTVGTCTKLYNEDWTPSKKYFPYMVQLWNDKKKNSEQFTASQLVQAIKEFDEVLPYLENKDIYSQDYSSYVKLKKEIFKGDVVREEKTFKREEHIEVLDENDDYLFLRPLTHRGSLKYGSGTRWCTASKYDVNTFTRYQKNGYLTYLISKKKVNQGQYEKIALWCEDGHSPFTGEIMIYNSNDDYVEDTKVLNNNWSTETLFRLSTLFRQKFYLHIQKKEAESNVKRKVSILENFDFDRLASDISIMKNYGKGIDEHLVQEFNVTVTEFIKNINYFTKNTIIQ